MWTDFLKVQDNAIITPFASLFNIEICRVNKNNSMNQISKFGIFALLLSSSLTIMVGTVIAPSLKEISVHLGFEENPGLLITLPSLGVVIFAPFVGKLIDRKGAYLMLRWGLILYALLGLLGGASYQPLFGCDRSYSFRCCYGVNTGSWNRLNCTIIHW
ncbi:MFS transporter [Sphingobacterium siyangense]|uniref:MFS transporter n=1 Tax=Sphingobacterium siyangense TaxID=459529 RepID=UPI0035E3EA76